MQQEIRMALFIIGVVIIGGVLIHGMWTIRKSKKASKRKASFESETWNSDFQHEGDGDSIEPIYDDLGVGKARVIKTSKQDKEDILEVDDNLKIDSQDILKEELDEETTQLYEFIKQNDENFDSPIENINTVSSDDGVMDDVSNNLEQDAANDDTIDEQPFESIPPIDKSDTSTTNETDKEPAHAIYSNVITQPKPGISRPSGAKDNSSDMVGEPPEFLLKKDSVEQESEPEKEPIQKQDAEHTSQADELANKAIDKNEDEFSLNIQDGPIKPHSDNQKKELSFAEQAKRFVRRSKTPKKVKERKEPKLRAGKDDQFDFNFDPSQNESPQGSLDLPSKKEKPSSKQTYKGEPEVLILNIKAAQGEVIEGAALLPMLLTLGFKFGEHDIFHRHTQTNGTGPILFSLTNIVKPGVFDIDNIENFSTIGLSLFMMLPCESDAQQVFNMMHNAARKLADEFSCKVLDANKVPLSKQSIQQYVERIREFDRKLKSQK